MAEEKEQEVTTMDIIKFDITEAAIAKLREDYMVLTVKGIDDKPGLDAVHRARMDIKNRRVQVTKSGKAYRDKLNVYIQDELAKEKRVLALLQPIEDHLSEEESRVTEEIARIKAEEKAREEARIKARADQLYKLGCRFDGTTWTFEGVEISAHNKIVAATDEQFNDITTTIQEAIDEAEKIRAEEARKKAEEEERLRKVAAEQEAERQRLAEVARKQKEEEERLQKEKERIEAEAKAKREAEEARIKEEQLAAAKKLADEEARIKAEQAAAQKKLDDEAARLKAEQESIEREKQRLKDEEAAKKKAEEDAKKKAEEEKARAEELEKAKKEAADKARKEAEEKARKEAEEKAAREEAARIRAEKKEARRPDKAKLLSYLQALTEVPVPELKTAEGIAVQEKIQKSLESCQESMLAWIEEL